MPSKEIAILPARLPPGTDRTIMLLGLVSRLCFLLCGALGTGDCLGAVENRGVQRACDAIAAAPAWSDTNEDNIERIDIRLMAAVRIVASLSQQDVRKIIECLLAKESQKPVGKADKIGTGSKIYVLNRFYFAVSEEELLPRARRFGGWVIPYEKGSKSVLVMWPLERDAAGKLHLAGIFQGYSGPGYQSLAEFDYFAKTYERRFR